MKIKNIWNLAATAVLAALLASCASTPAGKPEAGDAAAAPAATTESGVSVSSDPRAPLERRATDRWKLLIARDAARAYTYLTPGYRAGQAEGEYSKWLASRQIEWRSAAYVDHTCDSPDVCKVVLIAGRGDHRPRNPGQPQLDQRSSGKLVEVRWRLVPSAHEQAMSSV